MSKHTFLVEIGTEEIPPKELRTLGEDFSNNIINQFKSNHICYKKVQWFASPRRLAVKMIIFNNKNIEKIGPSLLKSFDSNGHYTTAAKKWAQNCGITLDKAEHKKNEKGEWLIYRTCMNIQQIQSMLCSIVNTALRKLHIKKIMYWGDNNVKFIRPVHTVTLLIDKYVIPGNVLGIKTDRIVRGHLFMGYDKIIIEHADQYPNILIKKGRVIANYFHRKEKIRRYAETAAKQIGGTVDINNSLLEEVTSLVEWPVVLTASFEKNFLSVPSEALVYIMKNDQKYFPIYNSVGNLLPYFIFVANIESKDSQKIISGNEKVLRYRLSDAEFFFNIDCKQRLEHRLFHLDKVLFHKNLGTLLDKSNRIETLTMWIADNIGADTLKSARAGLLSKCDLITNMVCEFTDIQGIMGMYYARYDGEPEEVALAQKEQYQPRFYNDILPSTLVSCTVAIADKIDTITGLFGIHQYPKGNKDPFALRRAAYGILRIIIEKKLPIDLQLLVEKSVLLYGNNITNNTVIDDVMNFMLNRIHSLYKERGVNINVIRAVLARRPTFPTDFDDRICAVINFLTLKESEVLIAINKRVINILKVNNYPINEKLNHFLFKTTEEYNLSTNLLTLNKKLQPLFKERRYQEALMNMFMLHEPVNNFFNNVIVMTDDDKTRINRLILLTHLRQILGHVADFSLL